MNGKNRFPLSPKHVNQKVNEGKLGMDSPGGNQGASPGGGMGELWDQRLVLGKKRIIM